MGGVGTYLQHNQREGGMEVPAMDAMIHVCVYPQHAFNFRVSDSTVKRCVCVYVCVSE